MNDKILKLMNKIINILSKLEYNIVSKEMYYEKVNINKIKEYIRFEILKDFSQDELIKLKSKIFNLHDNYSDSGILVKDGKITKVLIPKLSNILSAIIICHEFTHYITYRNKLDKFSYLSLYDELAPLNEEYVFLEEFYKEYLIIHRNQRFNEAITACKCLMNEESKNEEFDVNRKDISEIINELSHIYSLLILTQMNNYKENAILFRKINSTSNPLEYEMKENGIYLKKSIINELKNRD